MLRRSDRSRIDEYGYCTLHDFRLNSLSAGEPFFERDVLAYYDGRLVTLCGFPLEDQEAVSYEVIRDLAVAWVADRGAEAIVYVGPGSVDLRKLGSFGLRVVSRLRATRLSGEVVIDCSESDASARLSRVYRRSVRLPFTIVHRRPGIIASEHFKLIETVYRRWPITPYLAELAFALPAILRLPRTHIIEARQSSRLCGFVVLHRAFVKSLTGVLIAADEAADGVSDFLYAAMVDYATSSGARGVNVGASPTHGQFVFKQKWGASSVPPYSYVRWARGPLSRRQHVTWGSRLVRLQATT